MNENEKKTLQERKCCKSTKEEFGAREEKWAFKRNYLFMFGKRLLIVFLFKFHDANGRWIRMALPKLMFGEGNAKSTVGGEDEGNEL